MIFVRYMRKAFGLEALYWLNLQSQYNVDLARVDKRTSERLIAIKIIESQSQIAAENPF
jgi:plasmid maintenance system antidote protein VapI